MKSIPIIIFLAIMLSACRPPVEEVAKVEDNYSLDGVQSYALRLNCQELGIDGYERFDITELEEQYVEAYCDFLNKELTKALESKFPDWEQRIYSQPKQVDLFIQADLEQLYGGNQMLRFIPTFEAGRTMLTINFTIFRDQVQVAQRRLTEITRRIRFEDEKYTNEEAISADTKIMATYLADYLEDPQGFDQRYKTYWKDYNPH